MEKLDKNGLLEKGENIAKIVLSSAPGNHQATACSIQKDLIKCCGKETTRLIVEDLDNDLFAILADESSDVSHKEQLAICLSYLDKERYVAERFLSIVKVDDTSILEDIGSSSKCVDDRAKAQIALDHLESFEFIFMLHLMNVIFGYTNDLCQGLQRKDQDIINAMILVDLTMAQLQLMRDDGWDNFLETLALILPVATAIVERVFSFMKFVKNKMLNRIGDKILNHCLVAFIERDYFVRVSDVDIIKRYQNMKSRRMVLD
ncbi:uncharacterized protein LOC141632909 [Silene latifolia]|uniref:uncharacterized protein LOC141632909 n=1 Tax=Silene latifolia TaxID=37657 RepID=UPI003D771D12